MPWGHEEHQPRTQLVLNVLLKLFEPPRNVIVHPAGVVQGKKALGEFNQGTSGEDTPRYFPADLRIEVVDELRWGVISHRQRKPCFFYLGGWVCKEKRVFYALGSFRAFKHFGELAFDRV